MVNLNKKRGLEMWNYYGLLIAGLCLPGCFYMGPVFRSCQPGAAQKMAECWAEEAPKGQYELASDIWKTSEVCQERVEAALCESSWQGPVEAATDSTLPNAEPPK